MSLFSTMNLITIYMYRAKQLFMWIVINYLTYHRFMTQNQCVAKLSKNQKF